MSENLDYHVFRKPKKLKGGKLVHRWYYYFVGPTGKKVQKSCGKNVKKRQEAENYVRTLPPLQRLSMSAIIAHYDPNSPHKAALHNPPVLQRNPDMLIEDIAKYMFIPGSAHVQRRQQLKKSTSVETLTANRVFMTHITGTWGKRMLRTLELDEVMNYLFAVERSSSWKNQYIAALNEIYQEAQFMGCKVYKLDFPTIGKTPNKADMFTQDELEKFFKRENFIHDFFYLFFLCSLSGGLRLGETLGLKARQIILDKKAVIVDGYLKGNGARTTYNKKGTPEHPKLRVVPYPDFTLNLLQEHVTSNNIGAADYVFTYNGHPLSKTMCETAFNHALIKSGIAFSKEQLIEKDLWKGGHLRASSREIVPDGRRLIHHSLRYTYITRMSLDVDAHTLIKLTGHDSTAMIDYYNRKNLEMALAAIPSATAATSALLPPAIKQ